MDIEDYRKCFDTDHGKGPCGPKCVHTLTEAEMKKLLKKVVDDKQKYIK